MTLPLAQSGFSFLFYLLIGIIWLVGNLLQQRAAKRKAEELRRRREEREAEERRTGKAPPPDRPKPRTLEDELETFLGRLAGEPTPPPAPVKREPPPPPARPRVTPPPLKPKIEFDPVPQTKGSTKPVKATEVKVGGEIKKRSRIDEMDYGSSYRQMSELKEMEEAVSDLMGQDVKHEALEGVRSMMIDLSRTIITMPTMPIQSMKPERTKTSRPDLTQKQNVKRALVNAVILDGPKALQEQPFKERP